MVAARSSAVHAVRSILADEGGSSAGPYNYLPYFYSRFFDFSWKFYGVAEGDVHHFGTFTEGEKFGAVWFRDGRVGSRHRRHLFVSVYECVCALALSGYSASFSMLTTLAADRRGISGKR